MKDAVTIQTDTSNAGDEDPSYTAQKTAIPCRITSITGQETWRGRQLEATVDYVVEFGTLRTDVDAQARLVVTGGVHNGVTMNVAYRQRVQQTMEQRAHIDAFCRELAN